MLLLLLACTPDPCASDDPLATCLAPTQAPEWYVDQAEAYFDTMDSRVELEGWPPYADHVARWEWPPWLKLTAWTRENIEATDALLRLYPSEVRERDCRAFETSPFARCTVVFFYEAHEGRPCPTYEEFVFNDAGAITWIEAWSDVDGLRPTSADDPWGERGDIGRLSGRVPGLGRADGFVDPGSEAMAAAAAEDPDVADFVARTANWSETWAAEVEAAGDGLWAEGCGW